MLKPVHWVGTSRKALRELPKAARIRVGYELYRVQLGQEPLDWKPMPTVGPGVAEIRAHGDREHRVFYVAKFEDAIYILHAFTKKGRTTPALDLELGRARYRQLVRDRALGTGSW